jgi:hypothetical protein
MARRLINMRLPPELVGRADAEAKRLGQTRTKFVERALERALGLGDVNAQPQPSLSKVAKFYEKSSPSLQRFMDK